MLKRLYNNASLHLSKNLCSWNSKRPLGALKFYHPQRLFIIVKKNTNSFGNSYIYESHIGIDYTNQTEKQEEKVMKQRNTALQRKKNNEK